MTLTLRHAASFLIENLWKGEIILEPRLYSIGEFAAMACVSLRTLRYYDRVGLLSPSCRTEAGYRLYTERELVTLQQILALKFLGFSLEEIRTCLQREPGGLEAMLSRQQAMMRERRRQLDVIIAALGGAEQALRAGQDSREAIVQVIAVIQMEQKQEWVKKYFTNEARGKLEELSQSSYSEEARQKLAQREWTEQDQERASAQWSHVAVESRRLAESGADPAGPEGQALAKLKSDLLFEFTQGDPEIIDGLSQFWQNHNALPEGQRPLDAAVSPSVVPGATDDGARFLARAMEIYQEQKE